MVNDIFKISQNQLYLEMDILFPQGSGLTPLKIGWKQLNKKNIGKQAGAELGQAQYKIGYLGKLMSSAWGCLSLR